MSHDRVTLIEVTAYTRDSGQISMSEFIDDGVALHPNTCKSVIRKQGDLLVEELARRGLMSS